MSAIIRSAELRLRINRVPEPLTRSEQDVAALAAAGLRNAEIGIRLFITTRTVESHLSHIYQKLGVRSRTELAIAIATGIAREAEVEECWRCHAPIRRPFAVA